MAERIKNRRLDKVRFQGTYFEKDLPRGRVVPEREVDDVVVFYRAGIKSQAEIEDCLGCGETGKTTPYEELSAAVKRQLVRRHTVFDVLGRVKSRILTPLE